MAQIYPYDRSGKSSGGMAAYIVQTVDEFKRAMRRMHEQWYHQVLFFQGDQFTYLDGGTGRVQHIPVAPWRQRIKDNQTRPQITHMQALLLQRSPTYQALARGEEEEDLIAADGYEALLAYDWDRMGLTQEYADCALWSLITGNGFLRCVWNPGAGDAVLVPVREGEDAMLGKDAPNAEDQATTIEDPFGQTLMEEILFEGDVDVVCRSPFNIGVNLTATSMRKISHLHDETFIHRDVLRDKIGSRADRLLSDTTPGEFRAYQQSLAFDSHGGGETIGSHDVEGLVRVIEFWQAPTKKHPEGRVITVAGREILHEKPNPYGGRIPYVHFPSSKVPGRFWADGVVKDLIPLQKAHNTALSRYHDIMMQCANPKVIADFGCGIKETNVNDQPGEVIFKRRGYDVQFVTPPAPSPIHPQMIGLTSGSMQTITGVNDPLAGANPPNVRAAATVRALQEAGMRRFTPLALQHEQGLKELGRMLLYLHKRFYTKGRTFAVLGPDADVQTYHMEKADIDRIFDVTVAYGSLMPKSAAAQAEMAIQTLQFAPHLFTDEQGRPETEHVLRMLDMPTFSGRVSPRRSQRMRCYREHISVANGEPIVVHPFDDDRMHIQLHAIRLSSDTWVQKNPVAAQELMAHYQQHEQQLMMKMQGGMIDPSAPNQPPEQPAEPGAGAPSGASGPVSPDGGQQFAALPPSALGVPEGP